jgi:hypothetical protein
LALVLSQIALAGVVNDLVIGDLIKVRARVVARTIPVAEVIKQLRKDVADDIIGGVAAQAESLFAE